MNTAFESTPRQLTNDELGQVVRHHRECRQWSQDTLAELAKVTGRTIQRVESGEGASKHTRRAIAGALEIADIDVFNKPLIIPTDEELNAAKEKFEKEYLTLKAHPIESGKHLARQAEASMGDMINSAVDMSPEAEESFALLTDLIRDWRDCAPGIPEASKLEIYREFQGHIDALEKLRISLRYAAREMRVTMSTDAEGAAPLKAQVLYLIAFALGEEPEEFVTPRSMPIGF